jgi:membrane fusion protein (multidrug efflux system)
MSVISKLKENPRWWLASIAILVVLVLAVVFWPSSGKQSGREDGFAAAVELAPVATGAVAILFEGVGSAEAVESIVVTAKESGIVGEIHFQPGQRVELGQLLLSLDTRELSAELAVTQAQFEQAELEARRAERLIKTNSVSQDQYDALQAQLRAARARMLAARARFEDAMIHAPFAGVVGLRDLSIGALVEPGRTITTLDDISTIKLVFNVPEIYLAKLQPGLPLIAKTPAYPDREFIGELVAVDSRIDPATRSIRVEGRLPNDDGMLKSGLFMTVRLSLDSRQNALLIPEQALLPRGRQQYVYLPVNGKAVLREVQLGQRLPGKVEILEGVKAGDQVVIAGLQKLYDGAAIQVLNQQSSESAAVPPVTASE